MGEILHLLEQAVDLRPHLLSVISRLKNLLLSFDTLHQATPRATFSSRYISSETSQNIISNILCFPSQKCRLERNILIDRLKRYLQRDLS